ncbi:MAG: Phosphoheptose isomerase [Phycisphaerae bacterium]|nr:Phosphoheptose isomerase [Phycisphaerae bacterium]
MTRSWSDILDEHLAVARQLADAGPTLDRVVDALRACFSRGGQVYILGNGGSAADAQHIAAELLGRFKRDRRALPALALTTDSSTLTAVANDLGYERTFARQIEGLVRKGDVVWALSTSGNSPNVLAALRAARAQGAITIGFSGHSGGGMVPWCDLILRVPHASSDRVQEAHQIAYHYVCERIEVGLCDVD